MMITRIYQSVLAGQTAGGAARKCSASGACRAERRAGPGRPQSPGEPEQSLQPLSHTDCWTWTHTGLNPTQRLFYHKEAYHI